MSSIARTRTVAYARKTRPTGESEAVAPDEADAPPEDLEAARAQAARYESEAQAAKDEKPAEDKPAEDKPAEDKPVEDKPAEAEATKDEQPAEDKPADKPEKKAKAKAEPAPAPAEDLPRLHADEPEPDRAHSDTVMMPFQASLGAPPAMPKGGAAPPVGDVSVAEAPTHMPGPREIPSGKPDDPARPPGTVPSGDSRSLRRRGDSYEFALVYRLQTYVITRSGVVGTRGQWRVVEYPTSASASHSYAKECSRFAAEGFSDYRD